MLSQQKASSSEEAEQLLTKRITDGSALEKFREMVRAQGGDLDVPRPLAPTHVISASRSGCLTSVDGVMLGQAVIELGGGRKRMGDPIDHRVGLEMLVRIGDRVAKGAPLVRVYGAPPIVEQIRPAIAQALAINEADASPRVLIHERITLESEP